MSPKRYTVDWCLGGLCSLPKAEPMSDQGEWQSLFICFLVELHGHIVVPGWGSLLQRTALTLRILGGIYFRAKSLNRVTCLVAHAGWPQVGVVVVTATGADEDAGAEDGAVDGAVDGAAEAARRHCRRPSAPVTQHRRRSVVRHHGQAHGAGQDQW